MAVFCRTAPRPIINTASGACRGRVPDPPVREEWTRQVGGTERST
jgi:hypothetical protein